ncbi:hypothetical protein LSAT2_005294 [Lamellibrachia satsuma]|nr:hypothetical protein LSAT2_005294 [Lamellibrachia satsuma]
MARGDVHPAARGDAEHGIMGRDRKVHPDPETGVVRPVDDVWTWHHLVTGTIAFLCCPFPCGIISFVSALLSYTDYKVGRLADWRRKRRLAKRCGIAAILCGVAFSLFLWFAYALFLHQLVQRQQLIATQQSQLQASVFKQGKV